MFRIALSPIQRCAMLGYAQISSLGLQSMISRVGLHRRTAFAPLSCLTQSIRAVPTATGDTVLSRFPPPASLFEEFITFIKRTFQPSIRRRKRKHGFLKRLSDRHGKKIIKNRLKKGRKELSL
ncbi:hypothetical protein TrCOL_g3219 [Triparma columacea]|uniref:Large ribosomal subunit protein bL34m n=1 Tax=Triparma columacea TaxID=722753 RepID=A0A9W7G2M7_9STRA|nr:hypothetical protein TrCOL_g3219 [Triparma columacea]